MNYPQRIAYLRSSTAVLLTKIKCFVLFAAERRLKRDITEDELQEGSLTTLLTEEDYKEALSVLTVHLILKFPKFLQLTNHNTSTLTNFPPKNHWLFFVLEGFSAHLEFQGHTDLQSGFD